MEIKIKKCDKCKDEKRNDIDKEEYDDFQEINIHLGNKYGGDGYLALRKYEIKTKNMHLCKKCLEKVGITIKKVKLDDAKELPTNKLYDLIAEIVGEALENH